MIIHRLGIIWDRYFIEKLNYIYLTFQFGKRTQGFFSAGETFFFWGGGGGGGVIKQVVFIM